MDIRLIAFDLDGTLLRRDKSISPRTLQALQAAKEKGVLLVPATGRLYRSLPEALLDEQLSRYFILVNGAQVYDAEKDETLLKEELSPSLALPMLQFLKTRNVVRGVYIDGLGHMSREDYTALHNVAKTFATETLLRRSYCPTDDLEKFTANAHSVQKIIAFFHDVSEKQPVLREIKKLAIVMGSEGPGLKPETIAQCDHVVTVPMTNGVDSLNVAAASAVAFYQLALLRKS